MTRQEIHKTYRLGIAWGAFALIMGMNWVWTADRNALAEQVNVAYDQAKLQGMMDAGGAPIELLPPPVF